MTDLHPGNAAIRWTTTFFRTLGKLGTRHIIISPGSRSTPLTLAAAAIDHFEKQVILDERSAAFTALGAGKATDIPAVLICTSGTAAANYYPAVIEARQSGIPMILATADRPAHRRATGANQAIDQLKMFNDYPVFFHEVGEPGTKGQELQRLQMLGRQAFTIAREKRGPVHLNFPFSKPLEPEKKVLDSIRSENKKYFPGQNLPSPDAGSFHLSDTIQKQISEAKKPLIIAGPLAPKDHLSSIAALAEQIAAPVLTESTFHSPNTISGFAGFLRNQALRKELAPDLILRFGFQPTAKGIEYGLGEWQPDHHFHFSSTGAWQDATFSAAERIPWAGKEIHFDDIVTAGKGQWLEKWKEVSQHFQSFCEKIISQTSPLTDGVAYHHLTPQISNDTFIAVSNSFPARDISLFGRQPAGTPLFLNRGASGIDGITSTAMGLSLALRQPGVLFTGDLAFLHDSNALLNQKIISDPLTIVVINNAGGSIFRMLPVEQHEEYFKPYFETPQSADLSRLADAHDIPFQRISSLSALKETDLANWMSQHSGLSIIECQTDPDASMMLRRKLWNYQP